MISLAPLRPAWPRHAWFPLGCWAWTMFYFGVGRGGAHIMIAFSRDLLHWTAHPEPLYKAGGHPAGLDKTYAHKISLVYNPNNETYYMHYCAVGTKGRCIGLLTSKPLPR